MLVVGEKDMAAGVVSPRTREGQQLPAVTPEVLGAQLAKDAQAPRFDAQSPVASGGKARES